uniref:CKLF-like MARVEL transmembrane domain-containing protein 1 n=1 Tax=Jaculus jaculus TaxID=51337 RepID=UPI001E1B1940|nr:CKLF-like MARVEL transmembrane domain-containing protein 1 [Jaculus jaculus]
MRSDAGVRTLPRTPRQQQVHSVRSEGSVHTLPRTPTEWQREPKSTPTPKVPLPSDSVKKQAEGQAKVPEKLTDNCKDFFFSAMGILKIIRMCLITAAAVCFINGHAHDVFIAITIQEICISLFFIISYMVTLQHLLSCLHWPLLDLINSIISAIFLSVVGIVTIQEKGRRHLLYVGGILCLTAAILCVIDGSVAVKKMMERKNEAPGTESKPSEIKVDLASGPPDLQASREQARSV